MNNIGDVSALIPIILTVCSGLFLMLFDAFWKGRRDLIAYVSLALLAMIGAYVVGHWVSHEQEHFRYVLFERTFVVDSYSYFFYGLFILTAALTVLMSRDYLEQEDMEYGEYYALIFFAVAGMMIMASGNDLIPLFLGLETMSLAIYALVGLRRGSIRSNEAVLKYFILGAFSAGFFLYGIALIYGIVGYTGLYEIRDYLKAYDIRDMQLLYVAFAMILIGLTFKVGAVPFHMWVPDAYEGAPLPITAFMSTAVKAAAFAMILRIFFTAFTPIEFYWYEVIWWLAVLTMFIGNILALVQDNVKRMLAYSSVAHSGYLLLGLAAMPQNTTLQSLASGSDVVSSILFYLFGYSLTTLGAFACLTYLSKSGENTLRFRDLAGAGKRHPWVALCMALCMFSLIGLPPTVGFFGKYYLFSAAIAQGFIVLAIIGIINSILSVYYYLRVVVSMMMEDAEEDVTEDVELEQKVLAPRFATKLVAGYTAIALLWAGVGTVNLLAFPGVQTILTWAKMSVQSLI